MSKSKAVNAYKETAAIPVDGSKAPELTPYEIALNMLGFRKGPLLHGKHSWHNPEYDISVPHGAAPSYVTATLVHAVQRKAIRSQQEALRDALLPALGLSMHTEHDDGYITRQYVTKD